MTNDSRAFESANEEVERLRRILAQEAHILRTLSRSESIPPKHTSKLQRQATRLERVAQGKYVNYYDPAHDAMYANRKDRLSELRARHEHGADYSDNIIVVDTVEDEDARS